MVRHTVVAGYLLLGAVGLGISGQAPKPSTIRASVSSSGTQANGKSDYPSLSADGRHVIFLSEATNLVPGDTNKSQDVFLRDLKKKITVRVSSSTAGEEANGDSYSASISASGRYVTFGSAASNLVSGDTNKKSDVFVKDRKANKMVRASLSSSGQQANGMSTDPALSANGRYVVFESHATNLVEGDTNGHADIFVRDLVLNVTARVSLSSSGQEIKAACESPSIAADGRHVVFSSHSGKFVMNDTNGKEDIFLRDVKLKTTICLSVSSSGIPGDDNSYSPMISADGRYAVFVSEASNLVEGDTNKSPDVFVRDLKKNVTKRVSVSSSGGQANADCIAPSISANGRYVAFMSWASNLAGQSDDTFHIFVRDNVLEKTFMVSVNSSGAKANDFNQYPSLSGDGRTVAFVSNASNMVVGDANGVTDIFVRGPLHQGAKP